MIVALTIFWGTVISAVLVMAIRQGMHRQRRRQERRGPWSI